MVFRDVLHRVGLVADPDARPKLQSQLGWMELRRVDDLERQVKQADEALEGEQRKLHEAEETIVRELSVGRSSAPPSRSSIDAAERRVAQLRRAHELATQRLAAKRERAPTEEELAELELQVSASFARIDAGYRELVDAGEVWLELRATLMPLLGSDHTLFHDIGTAEMDRIKRSYEAWQAHGGLKHWRS